MSSSPRWGTRSRKGSPWPGSTSVVPTAWLRRGSSSPARTRSGWRGRRPGPSSWAASPRNPLPLPLTLPLPPMGGEGKGESLLPLPPLGGEEYKVRGACPRRPFPEPCQAVGQQGPTLRKLSPSGGEGKEGGPLTLPLPQGGEGVVPFASPPGGGRGIEAPSPRPSPPAGGRGIKGEGGRRG
ncbi:protein of unknown function [Candidatus Bipolaricaulis anaerobius]|uniref:Uncharacterized protein n=1 Tax=Candidatus Bipolaricaulis anaerobius TaxID=2026885 RepID=A0A2X3KYN1_9BACT|nr:protein of unknown function [Candidatus Bipolaricaulis anaerobius]